MAQAYSELSKGGYANHHIIGILTHSYTKPDATDFQEEYPKALTNWQHCFNLTPENDTNSMYSNTTIPTQLDDNDFPSDVTLSDNNSAPYSLNESDESPLDPKDVKANELYNLYIENHPRMANQIEEVYDYFLDLIIDIAEFGDSKGNTELTEQHYEALQIGFATLTEGSNDNSTPNKAMERYLDSLDS